MCVCEVDLNVCVDKKKRAVNYFEMNFMTESKRFPLPQKEQV